MGCDIHVVLEQKYGDKWVGINSFEMHHHRKYSDDAPEFSFPVVTARNYERFAALAGVRGSGPEPKGIPDDASDLSKMKIKGWGVDGHSHSWLSLKEAVRIWKDTEYIEMPEYPKPEDYYFGIYEDDLENNEYRVVFWFDN